MENGRVLVENAMDNGRSFFRIVHNETELGTEGVSTKRRTIREGRNGTEIGTRGRGVRQAYHLPLS